MEHARPNDDNEQITKKNNDALQRRKKKKAFECISNSYRNTTCEEVHNNECSANEKDANRIAMIMSRREHTYSELC